MAQVAAARRSSDSIRTSLAEAARGANPLARNLATGAQGPALLLSLQRTVGNRATTLFVQRNGGNGGTAVKGSGNKGSQGSGQSPDAKKAADLIGTFQKDFDKLDTFCDAGEEIAWDLYRAMLQLQNDMVFEKTGRQGGAGDPGVEKAVGEASEARTKAVTAFKALKQDGQSRWDAAKQKATAKNLDWSGFWKDIFALDAAVRSAAQGISGISERAWKAAITAEGSGHLVAARHAFRAADAAELVQRQSKAVELGKGRPPTDVLGTLYGAGYGVGLDTGASTVFSGTAGNIISGVTLGQTTGTLGNLSTGSSAVLGPLGILCGTIDLGVAIAGAVKSKHHERQLSELTQLLADPKARQIGVYAAQQKETKYQHRLIMSGAAFASLAAGIAGCVAIGISTFGVGALVIGVAAAVIGIGIIAYKIYRKSEWARSRKTEAFARSLIQMAQDANADAGDRDLARQEIANLGVTVAGKDYSKVSAGAVADKLKERGSSQRQEMANGLLYLLVNGARSERRDAGEVLKGLGLDPDELAKTAEGGNPNAAEAQIMPKLASW